MASFGLKVYLIDKPYNKSDDLLNIIRVSALDDIIAKEIL